MKLKDFFLFFILLFLVTGVFFYKFFFLGQIPFPGDLLTTVSPFKTESYLGYAPSGYPNKAQDPDVLYEIYPWRYFSIGELKKGHIPFWNPHNFSGNLQMQDYQSAIFYPLNIFYFLFTFNIAWTIIVLSQPLLAGVFMYLFLRSLRLERYASGMGGFAFAFSSYMTVWLEYGNIGSTILWLPVLLFLLKRWVEKKKVIYFLLFIGSLFTAFLAGYIQGVFYLYVVSFLYLIFLICAERKKISAYFIISSLLLFILPILLTSFQLIPTLELFLRSTRGAYSLNQIETNLQPVWYWVTILVPDFFGHPASRNMWVPLTYIERVMYPGVPILFFALFSLFSVKHKEKLFFALLAGLFLLLTTNFPGIKYLYLLPIPMVSTTVPTRALSIFIFSLIVLAAIGIDCWIKQEISNKRRILYACLFTSLYTVIWIVILFVPKLYPSLILGFAIAKHNLVLPTGIAMGTIIVFISKKYYRMTSVYVLSILVFIDLFYFFIKITPFAPPSLIYPKTAVVSYLQQHTGIDRFWGYGDGYISPNFQSIDGTYSPEGNDPLHLKDYGILLQSTKNGRYPSFLPRPDANIALGYGQDDLRNNTYRQTILNLLGVKYVLNLNYNIRGNFSYDPAFSKDIYQLIWQKTPWQIYKNNKVLPRFFIASHYTVVHNKEDVLKKLYTIDLKKILILETSLSIPITENAKGIAKLEKYEPNEVIINTISTGNALLFLSDNYYPSWKAAVDGKQTPIYKADFSFRAVNIPPGNHIVRFYYSHDYFNFGLIIASIGFFITVLSMLFIRRYGKKI